LQEVGQDPACPLGIVTSHHSPASTVPFPQGSVEQMFLWVQVTSHPEPCIVSCVHGLPSSHEAGQPPHCPEGMPVSQFSPGSSTPFPQAAGQSLSVV
jgi:hypothetical protein